jgi:phage terminase large subunit GpA-like protein
MTHVDYLLSLYESEITTELPSEWAANNRILTSDVTAFPGKASLDRFPYWKEPLDLLSPDDPTHIITIMGGAQIGKSTNFIESGIGYLIKNHPGNIVLTSADKEMTKTQMSKKIDNMLANSGLSYLIRPNTIKKKNLKTGDRDDMKEFPGGSLMAQSVKAVDKIKQNSFRYGFFDDFEAAVRGQKQAGDILDLLFMRFNSFKDKMKISILSTPEVKQSSMIEPAFLMGDQRYYNMHCPKCGDLINYIWNKTEEETGEIVGVYFEKDENNKLIEKSVGYVCQKCGGFFKETHKKDMMSLGNGAIWIPTAEPSRPDWKSYHISGLYSPPGFFDWTHHVRQWMNIFPENGIIQESKLQVFTNLVLGLTYEETAKNTDASLISRNLREYKIGVIPDEFAESDGNGKIIMLTCACDLNGFEDDCRLDYEIVAHSQSGSTYSIEHGSVGTFQRGASKEGRELWNYFVGQPRNVWDVFREIVSREFEMQSGKKMRIVATGVDSGHFTQHVYQFVEQGIPNMYAVSLKGDADERSRPTRADTMTFKKSRERFDMYLVQTNQIKDYVSECMKLKQIDSAQPAGFMNYPSPENGLYDYRYFDQYEAEVRRPVNSKNGIEIAYVWEKKTSQSANHWFDCRVYNIAIRDIFAYNLVKAYNSTAKIKVEYTWANFVKLILNQ